MFVQSGCATNYNWLNTNTTKEKCHKKQTIPINPNQKRCTFGTTSVRYSATQLYSAEVYCDVNGLQALRAATGEVEDMLLFHGIYLTRFYVVRGVLTATIVSILRRKLFVSRFALVAHGSQIRSRRDWCAPLGFACLYRYKLVHAFGYSIQAGGASFEKFRANKNPGSMDDLAFTSFEYLAVWLSRWRRIQHHLTSHDPTLRVCRNDRNLKLIYAFTHIKRMLRNAKFSGDFIACAWQHIFHSNARTAEERTKCAGEAKILTTDNGGARCKWTSKNEWPSASGCVDGNDGVTDAHNKNSNPGQDRNKISSNVIAVTLCIKQDRHRKEHVTIISDFHCLHRPYTHTS